MGERSRVAGKKPKLNDRRRAFCDEYLQHYNAAEAWRKAGYSGKQVNMASQLLKVPEVAEYLQEQMAKMNTQKIASAQEVLEKLTYILQQGTNREAIEAAKLLGKYHKLFEDRLHIEGTTNTIVIDDLSEAPQKLALMEKNE